MSRDPKKTPRFRHRIKDLMILNVVLAISLALGIGLTHTLKKNDRLARALLTGLIVLPTLAMVIVGPMALVETYLYGKKKGSWYRLRNPTKPRPQYQRPDDLPPVSPRMPVPAFLEDQPAQPRSPTRTRLFESSSPAEPVSRAKLLLALAGRFEADGRIDAAAHVYHQILDRFTDAAEAHDAACRLRRLLEKKDQAPDC